MFTDAELRLQSAAHYRQKLRLFEKAAADAEKTGDKPSRAAAILHLGYTFEKLRNFSEADRLIHRAIELYGAMNDCSGAAECYHTLGVLTFHNGSSDEAVRFFDKACRLREELQDHLSCAQSWHNRAYVHCRLGQAQFAFDCYARAEREVDAGCAAGQARLVKNAKEHKDTGFILSHMAFAHAKFTGRVEALKGANRYFEHVSRTGIHREHLLVYLAIALSLCDGVDMIEDSEIKRITEFTGLSPDPTSFFEFVLSDKDERTYLGTVVLGLMEFGRFLIESGQRARGVEMLRESMQLCIERGWKGEVERAARFAQFDPGK